MKNINNYILEKLKLDKNIKNESDFSPISPDEVKSLDDMISAIRIKNDEDIIGVCTVKDNYPGLISIDYPLNVKDNYVGCGSTSIKVGSGVIIRPASQQEIKMWRNADGVGKSARKVANTIEKVKAIKWINASLYTGGKFINFYRFN